MFVMINASDNPWMILLLLFVQVIVPLLQTDAANDSSSYPVMNLLMLLMLAFIVYVAWKFVQFGRVVYAMRGQYPEMGWYSFLRLAATQMAAMERANRAGTNNAATRDATNSENFNRIMRTIQVMPTEEFQTPAELKEATISELKERLKRREVPYAGCVERNELVDLLVTFRGGPSNNDTCCICCEEYQSGDVLRLLRKCKHEFHLECLDKWAFTSVTSERTPSCPLCNQALE